MSRSIDQFTTPFSPAEAFCIGGIISACDVHTNETGTSIWVLPVIHNPQKATPESLSAHKKHLENVFAEIPTITVSKGESDFTKYMQPNKIIKLPKMPHNANGKIDRAKLKTMYEEMEK